ncbi:hypothetical protein [Bradyrhizobium sp. URHC0002]|jgi:hypothetical protein
MTLKSPSTTAETDPPPFAWHGSIIVLESSDRDLSLKVARKIARETGRGVNVRDANLALVETIPAYDDDNYILDAEGNRILIGLTAQETREFERLDDLMSYANFVPTDDSQSLNERRWLVLYDKHQAAARDYISTENAKALRALREQSDSDYSEV